MYSPTPLHFRPFIGSILRSPIRSSTHPLQLSMYLRKAAESLPAVEELQLVVPAGRGRGGGWGRRKQDTLFSKCEQLHVRVVAGRNSAATRNP